MSICASTDEYEFTRGAGWETREAALEDLAKEFAAGVTATVWTGVAVPRDPATLLPRGDTLDRLQQAAYDIGGDYAEDWARVEKHVEADLDEAVEGVIRAWLAKHKIETTWFEVDGVQKHTIIGTGPAAEAFPE